MNPIIIKIARSGLAIIDRIESILYRCNTSDHDITGEHPVHNILIWSMDRIGDVVRTTPAIRMLKNRYPDASITAVIAGRAAPVLMKNPWIRFLHNIKNPYNLKEHFETLLILRKTKWDILIFFEVDEFWAKLGQLLSRFLSVQRIVAFDFCSNYPKGSITVSLNENGSWADQFITLAEYAGGVYDNKGMEIHISSQDHDKALEILNNSGISKGKPFFLVIPGGNFLTISRQWSPESYASLVSMIGQKWNFPVIVTGIKEEYDIAEKIKFLARTPVINLAGVLTLGELMAVIDLCLICISNDTGPLHISHALGKPTVAIVGPTAPEVIGIPENSIVVRKELPCSPCAYYSGWQSCSNPVHWECINAIAAEDVINAINTHLKGRYRGSPA